MEVDKYGRAYTFDRHEAYKYRVRKPNLYVPKGKTVYEYSHLFSVIKRPGKSSVYALPACLGKQYNQNPKTININISPIILKDWQEDFEKELDKVYTNKQKTLLALSETATGKSYAIRGAIDYFKQTTVIAVPKIGILVGLQEKFGKYLDMKLMKADEVRNAKELPDVLLITTASFNKVYDKINDYYNILILDEAHRVSDTRIKQMNLWKGNFILGVTASPQRKNFGLDGFKMLFGNIRESGAKSLKEQVITYEFPFNYSFKELEKAQEGLAVGHPELYRRLFINNKKRTQALVRIIGQLYNKGIKKLIVFVDRKEHIKTIREQLTGYNIIEMSGNTDIEESLNKTKDSKEYVILGILGSVTEGIDITNLELGIMFVSTSRINTILQTIGRMKREYKGKIKAMFIDFVDIVQFEGSKKKKLGYYARRRIYKQEGYDIIDWNTFINN